MTSRRWVIAVLFCGAAWTIGSAGAADTSIQGLVTNNEGKPIAGAEVRADRLDISARRIVTMTDAGGRYAFNNLPAGPYTITVVGINGAKSNPRTAYSADSGQPVRRFISAVPYQLRPDFDPHASSNAKMRYVWKPGETGTHIGGQWIKVPDARQPSTNPLEKTNGDLSVVPSLRINSLH
jgi:hypothetical protein